MGAAIESAIPRDSVTDHLSSAVGTYRRQFLDGAFEAVENMPMPRCDDLESKIVFVTANLTLSHDCLHEIG
jgi:hypothetical protein